MTTLAESPTTASLALGVASKVGSVGGSAIWAAGSYLVGGAVTVAARPPPSGLPLTRRPRLGI